MERPTGKNIAPKRTVTGELVYLNTMRQAGQMPGLYDDQTDMAIQMYEAEADGYNQHGVTLPIIEAYEQYDAAATETELSCVALADELLALKGESPLSFVDIVVEAPAEQVLAQLHQMRAGTILSADDSQLAFESDGSYYPILDIKKQDMTLNGVGLRAFGWDDDKVVFTDKPDETYDYHKHLLVYPADEKTHRRELEIQFSYRGPDEKSATESVHLVVDTNGRASISSNIYVHAYAETGYEGHNGVRLDDCTDADLAAYGDLVASIVGDQPESIGMLIDRQLDEISQSVASHDGKLAVQRLIDETWPAQARYLLRRRTRGEQRSIAADLTDAATADAGVQRLNILIDKWRERRQQQ